MPEEGLVRRMVKSHGTGEFLDTQFARIGEGVVFEGGVLVFHPENIEIGNDVYVGHYTILKGYFKNKMVIGDGTWIGQQCFFHSAGGLVVGSHVGIGPGVRIVTSEHDLTKLSHPILHSPVLFSSVFIEDNCDIGMGAIILPGVHIGRGVQVGAGAVVTTDVKEFSIVAGVPAKTIRMRT